jgi:hypothetical protein
MVAKGNFSRSRKVNLQKRHYFKKRIFEYSKFLPHFTFCLNLKKNRGVLSQVFQIGGDFQNG